MPEKRPLSLYVQRSPEAGPKPARTRPARSLGTTRQRLTLGAGQPYTASSRPDPSGRRPMSNRTRSSHATGSAP